MRDLETVGDPLIKLYYHGTVGTTEFVLYREVSFKRGSVIKWVALTYIVYSNLHPQSN